MYSLTDVTKTHAKGRTTVHALNGVTLAVDDGDWLAIQGPDRARQHHAAAVLSALDRPTSGRLLLDGHDLTTADESRLARSVPSTSASSSRPSTCCPR
jgi:putative ABC transport system ATP-binding protein